MVSPISSLPIKLLSKLGAAPHLLSPTRGAPVILMYHGVTAEQRGDSLTDRAGKHVPLELFRRHLQLLSRSRRVAPLTTLVDAVRSGAGAEGMIAITFDDGYLDNAECAAPLLAEFKLPATFFLATGFIGAGRWAWVDRLEAALHRAGEDELDLPVLGERRRLGDVDAREQILARIKRALKELPWQEAERRVGELEQALRVSQPEPWGPYRFMSWNDARDLAAAGFEVGAHTVNHAILSRVSVAEAEQEILASRDKIGAEVGSCSSTFCYPNGKRSDYTPDIMDFCSRHFTAALSTELGAARADELFQLRRIPVDGKSGEPLLASMVVQAE